MPGDQEAPNTQTRVIYKTEEEAVMPYPVEAFPRVKICSGDLDAPAPVLQCVLNFICNFDFRVIRIQQRKPCATAKGTITSTIYRGRHIRHLLPSRIHE